MLFILRMVALVTRIVGRERKFELERAAGRALFSAFNDGRRP